MRKLGPWCPSSLVGKVSVHFQTALDRVPRQIPLPPSLPLFLQGGLPAHSAFGGCKDPSISSAARYPKGQLFFMLLAWSFLDCCGLAQRILGAEEKCQLLVLPQPGMEIPDAYLLSRCRLQTRTHSKCSRLEVMRHGTAA